MAPSPILCIGGATVDRIGRLDEPRERLGTSNIGRMRTGLGGVARNVAETLARLGADVALLTRLGDDADGRAVREVTMAAGVSLAPARVGAGRTASYTAVLNGTGELVIGLADMDILAGIGPVEAAAAIEALPPGSLVFVDANLDEATLRAAANAARGSLAAGPVSAQKCLRLGGILPRLGPLFLNRTEAAVLLDRAPTGPLARLADGLAGLGVRCGVLTDGPHGALVWDGAARHALPAPPARVVDVNGAGDALAGATLARLALGESLAQATRAGLAAAALTVEADATVRPDLSPALLAGRLAHPLHAEMQP